MATNLLPSSCLQDYVHSTENISATSKMVSSGPIEPYSQKRLHLHTVQKGLHMPFSSIYSKHFTVPQVHSHIVLLQKLIWEGSNSLKDTFVGNKQQPSTNIRFVFCRVHRLVGQTSRGASWKSISISSSGSFAFVYISV